MLISTRHLPPKWPLAGLTTLYNAWLQAMVGSDMLAFLTTAIQVLQAAEDTGKKELQGRREFVHACWQFATTVLVECKQIAKLTVVSRLLTIHRHAILWPMFVFELNLVFNLPLHPVAGQ